MNKFLLQILIALSLGGISSMAHGRQLTPGDHQMLQEWLEWDVYQGALPESLINFINNPTVISDNPGYRESAEIKALLDALNQHFQSIDGRDLQKALSETEYQDKLKIIQDVMAYF